jgi:hypothetical protein
MRKKNRRSFAPCQELLVSFRDHFAGHHNHTQPYREWLGSEPLHGRMPHLWHLLVMSAIKPASKMRTLPAEGWSGATGEALSEVEWARLPSFMPPLNPMKAILYP